MPYKLSTSLSQPARHTKTYHYEEVLDVPMHQLEGVLEMAAA
jgi:hypothetical protein